ncbi:MAG: helix-turn-helix transcriptional regulator [Bacteroidales bacterium]|nr:helix-turn-helix transcriptional regulator [Bacteroidales bacterium]
MKDRLQTILNLEKITAAQMAALLMIQRSTLSNLLSGRNNPSYDFILAIMTKLPNLNIEWLLRGEGRPYKNPDLNFKGERLNDTTECRQIDAKEGTGDPHLILSQSDTQEEPQYANGNLFGFSDLPQEDFPEETEGVYPPEEEKAIFHPFPALEAGELERRVNAMQQSEKEDISPENSIPDLSENPINEEKSAPTRQKIVSDKASAPVKVILLYSDGTFESFEK